MTSLFLLNVLNKWTFDSLFYKIRGNIEIRLVVLKYTPLGYV